MGAFNDSLMNQCINSNLELIIDIIKSIQNGKSFTNDELLKELIKYAYGILDEKDNYIIGQKNFLSIESDICRNSFTGKVKSIKNRNLYPRIASYYNLLAYTINFINDNDLVMDEINEKISKVASETIRLMVQFFNTDRKNDRNKKDKLEKKIRIISEKLNDNFQKADGIGMEGAFYSLMLNNYNCLADVMQQYRGGEISDKSIIVDKLVGIAKKILFIEVTQIGNILEKGNSFVEEERKALQEKKYDLVIESLYFDTYNQMNDNLSLVISIIKVILRGEFISNEDLKNNLQTLINGEFEVKKRFVKDMLSSDNRNEVLKEIEMERVDLINTFINGYDK